MLCSGHKAQPSTPLPLLFLSRDKRGLVKMRATQKVNISNKTKNNIKQNHMTVNAKKTIMNSSLVVSKPCMRSFDKKTFAPGPLGEFNEVLLRDALEELEADRMRSPRDAAASYRHFIAVERERKGSHQDLVFFSPRFQTVSFCRDRAKDPTPLLPKK